MRKIISLIILISFLFINAAYSSNLRPNLMGDKEKEAGRLKDAAEKIASGHTIDSKPWRTENPRDVFGQYDEILDRGYSWTQGHWSTDDGYWSSDNPLYTTSESVPDRYKRVPAKNTYISSRRKLWALKIGKMSEDDIEKCLKTFGVKDTIRVRRVPYDYDWPWKAFTYKNVRRVPRGLKKAILKKLQKLQQKRPETIPIIREKALELLEIDEENFREGLEPFIEDYIAIRDKIRKAGIEDNKVAFYMTFDAMKDRFIPDTFFSLLTKIVYMDEAPYILEKIGYKSYFTLKDVNRISELKKLYGDCKIRTTYTPAETETIMTDPGFGINPPIYQDPTYETITITPERYEINIAPLTILSTLRLTPVLFLDEEIAKIPSAFKNILAELKTKEGNIPVILLTKETEDTLEAKLKGLDLKGVQFRTPAELGLQDLEWDKDERVSDIADIENLRCIPLTQPLCESFKDLQRARDQV